MKGMIFKPDSIQAIIEGKKTQTRRVIKPQPKQVNNDFDGTWEWKEKGHYYDDLTLFNTLKNSSRYRVGETVYIKEQLLCNPIWGEASYRDGSPVFIYNEKLIKSRYILKWHWKSDTLSSRCMPREAARYFIRITDVRAERLQEIATKDKELMAEGIRLLCYDNNRTDWVGMAFEFAGIWNSINKDYPFESNPWVWVYTFRRVNDKRN